MTSRQTRQMRLTRADSMSLRGGALTLSQKYQDYADRHQQYADPPLLTDALLEENNPSERPGNIAQRGHGNDKADVIDRKRAKKGKKRQRTHSHSRPHPRLAQRSQDDPDNLFGPETGRFADTL